MVTTTTNAPLISGPTPAAHLHELTAGLYNPAALNVEAGFEQIASERGLELEPALDVFAKRIADGRSPAPETATEILQLFDQFATRAIGDCDQRAIDFEKEFDKAFSDHPIMRLRYQSFSPLNRDWANETLDSATKLVAELAVDSHALEEEICELRQAFNDPDGRITAAHDRIHSITNKLTVIMGFAQELRHKDLDDRVRRKFINAIGAVILRMTDRSVFDRDPIEYYSEMNPHVEVTVKGETPTFRNPRLHLHVVTALEHIAGNAFKAGAKHVKILAEWKPSDTYYTITIENDGPVIPAATLEQLNNRKGGSGWKILRDRTLKELDADFEIESPAQNSEEGPYGALVRLFIRMLARTGNEPDTEGRSKADSGPLPARRSIDTPSHALPAVQRPASTLPPIQPNLAGGVSCFLEEPVPVPARYDIKRLR